MKEQPVQMFVVRCHFQNVSPPGNVAEESVHTQPLPLGRAQTRSGNELKLRPEIRIHRLLEASQPKGSCVRDGFSSPIQSAPPHKILN